MKDFLRTSSLISVLGIYFYAFTRATTTNHFVSFERKHSMYERIVCTKNRQWQPRQLGQLEC